ncbi:reverse transcriptase domain-containing protein [Tanacetum coccineum]
MTSEVAPSKEINETRINKNEPPRLQEACTENMNERCSAVLLNELPLKEEYPRIFIIPCQVLKKHKESEDLAADHLSRFKNPHMKISLIILLERRCVAGCETLEILAHFHSGPTGGHHSASVTAKKVYESRFIGLVFLKMLMKAQALPTNDARVLVKFLRQLFARFGVPNALISDKETHFCNSQLEKALQRYGVTYKLSTAYHPQSNGQTEVTNRAIKRILERSVGYNPKDLSEKFNDAFRLIQLNELAELRDGAYENTRIYKERTKKWHDSRLYGDKYFKVGDKVVLSNSRLKIYPGKLKSKWSSPNIVKTVYPHWAIEITNRDEFSFKVNGQRLKKYYGGNIYKEDDEVIEFENGVT